MHIFTNRLGPYFQGDLIDFNVQIKVNYLPLRSVHGIK